eukprot:s456_g37.t1
MSLQILANAFAPMLRCSAPMLVLSPCKSWRTPLLRCSANACTFSLQVLASAVAPMLRWLLRSDACTISLQVLANAVAPMLRCSMLALSPCKSWQTPLLRCSAAPLRCLHYLLASPGERLCSDAPLLRSNACTISLQVLANAVAPMLRCSAPMLVLSPCKSWQTPLLRCSAAPLRCLHYLLASPAFAATRLRGDLRSDACTISLQVLANAVAPMLRCFAPMLALAPCKSWQTPLLRCSAAPLRCLFYLLASPGKRRCSDAPLLHSDACAVFLQVLGSAAAAPLLRCSARMLVLSSCKS